MSKRDLSTLDRDMFQGLGRILQEAMAHGIINDMVFNGLETGQTELQGLYVVQATKNCAIGTIRKTWDGRKFVYSKSSAACLSGQACEFTSTGYLGYTVATVAEAIGAVTLSIPAATHDALVANELRGGYCLIYDGSTNDVQFRRIDSNTAADANLAYDIVVDGALTVAVVIATSAYEIFQNPYAALRLATADTLPKAGIPAAPVSGADLYFWCQKIGPAWSAPQGTVIGREGKGVYWRHDGSLDDVQSVLGVTVPSGVTSQYAGHLIEGDYAGNGPLLMLQG